jgi:cytoskeletal protein RodZ
MHQIKAHVLPILQQQRLEEIGKYLRQVRLERQMSLETISEHTKIRCFYLAAIEAGNVEHLPEAVYVRGFIKQFANALELNGQELAMTFPLEFKL